MTIDGFDPSECAAFAGFKPEFARKFHAAVARFAKTLHIDVEGLANVPPGRALLVANHAFGWDVIIPMAAISQQLARPVWVLGDHAWWKVPFLRRLAAAVGVVEGSPENADRLLQADQLVLVLPGGLREAVKPRELRYQLLWGHRYGFVRLALRNRAPLVPLASIGTDELFDFVGNAYERGSRWLGGTFPVPLPRRILPIPHRVKIHFIVGEPMPCTGDPSQAEDLHAVRRVRREIAGALHELIEDELARRAGIDLG